MDICVSTTTAERTEVSNAQMGKHSLHRWKPPTSRNHRAMNYARMLNIKKPDMLANGHGNKRIALVCLLERCIPPNLFRNATPSAQFGAIGTHSNNKQKRGWSRMGILDWPSVAGHSPHLVERSLARGPGMSAFRFRARSLVLHTGRICWESPA